MVICLEGDSFLHMVQLMPLPLTVSCFSKIQIGFIFLVPAHVGSPGQRAVKRCLLNDVFMLNFNTLVLGLYFIAMFLLSHIVMLVWYVLMCCCHVRVTSLSFTQMAKQRIMQTVSKYISCWSFNGITPLGCQMRVLLQLANFDKKLTICRWQYEIDA